MRKFILLLCLCFSLQVANSQTETLTNQNILDMIEMGFESDLIISKIQHTATAFDVSLNALKELKSKGVASSIISEMVKSSGVKEAAKAPKTGIFVVTDSAEVQILHSMFSGSRTNTLAAAFSYGIASAKTKSMIQNVKSGNIVSKGNCTFMFYFKPNQDSNFAQHNWWFHTSTTPSEFALIKLDVNKRKNCREIEVGSANMWSGTQTGVKDKHVIDVEIKQVKDGVFTVSPLTELESGEYCFYYKGVVPQGGYNNQAAFDFSVQ